MGKSLLRRFCLLSLFLCILPVTTPSSGQPVQILIRTNSEHNIFSPGEEIRLVISVSENTVSGILSLEIRDFSGNRTLENTLTLEAGRAEISLTLTEGFYWAEALLQAGGEKVGSGRVGIAVIPVPTHEPAFDSPFGIQSPNFALARRAGVGWGRVDFTWSLIEKEENSFEWEETDRIVEEASQAGVRLLGILRHPPEWAARIPPGYEPRGRGVHEGWDSFPPRDLEKWGRYVYETVRRYENRVAAWEIWNEPFPDGIFFRGGTVEDYVDLLRVAYTEAKRADPDCVVVGLGGTNFVQAQRVFELGGFPYMDAASIHHYQPGFYPEFVFPRILSRTRSVVERVGGKGIWLTEIGWPTNLSDFSLEQNWGGAPVELQAKFLPRALILGLSEGLEKIFWFKMDDGPDPHNFEHNQGLLFHDGSPKPSYVSLATVARLLENSRYGGRLELAPRIYGYWFEGSGATVALWTTHAWAELILPPCPGVRVVGMMGEELGREIRNGKWHLRLSDSVQYLVCDNSSLQDLLSALRQAEVFLPFDVLPLCLLLPFAGLVALGGLRGRKDGFETDCFRAYFLPSRLSWKSGRALLFSLLMLGFASIWVYRLAGWLVYEFPYSLPSSVPGWNIIPTVVMGVLRNPLLLLCSGFAALVLYSAIYWVFCRIFGGKLGVFTCLKLVGWSTAPFILFLPLTLVGSRLSGTLLPRLFLFSALPIWTWCMLITALETRRLGRRAMLARVFCDLILLLTGLLLLFTLPSEELPMLEVIF